MSIYFYLRRENNLISKSDKMRDLTEIPKYWKNTMSFMYEKVKKYSTRSI